MPTRLELIYRLGKEEDRDKFDPEVQLRIEITGELTFLTPSQMENALPRAVMGLQQVGNSPEPHFGRLPQVDGLDIPDDANFDALHFRIITSAAVNDREREIAASYTVPRGNRYQITPGDVLPNGRWFVLVLRENGQFKLRCRKAGGPGSGNPCRELNCLNTEDWPTKVRCFFNGCAT